MARGWRGWETFPEGLEGSRCSAWTELRWDPREYLPFSSVQARRLNSFYHFVTQIRSVYRTVELSQGYVGPLATNEATFYGLDTLPLFIAVAVYMFFWPGRFLDPDRISATATPANGVVDGEGTRSLEAGSVELEKERQDAALRS